MTTFLQRAKYSPFTLIAALVALNLGLYYWAKSIGIEESAWSGWVQGVGSVEAILVAVWVTWHQAETQRTINEEAALSEMRGILRSFRTEIKISMEQAEKTVGAALNRLEAGSGFFVTLPVPEDPFVIYNALIPRLGLIRDDALCYRIVRAYTAAKSFVLTIRYNNNLLLELNRASERFQEAEVAKAHKALREYGEKVKESWLYTKTEVDQAMVLLIRI